MSRPINPANGVEEPESRDVGRAGFDPGQASAPTESWSDRDPSRSPEYRPPPTDPVHSQPGAVQSISPEPSPDAVDTANRGPAGPPAAGVDPRKILIRQRERFGGVKVGSAFFGWLTATGLATILITVLAVVRIEFGSVDQTPAPTGTGRIWTVGLVDSIMLLVILFVAYLAGGYVAGRMARFNGVRQGVAVWLWGVVITGLFAAVAALVGLWDDMYAQLNVPRVQISDQLWAPTPIAIAIAAAVALVGAILGGLVGMRFHRRVDRAGIVPVAEVNSR